MYNIQKPENRTKAIKYDDVIISNICTLISKGYTNKEIADTLGIDISDKNNIDKFWHFMKRIRDRKSYTYISDNYDW